MSDSPRRHPVLKLLAAFCVLPALTGALAGCAGLDLSALLRGPAPSPDTVAGGAAPLPWGALPGSAVRAGAASAVQDPAYRIGPEDGLEIAVWKDETLKSTVLVRPGCLPSPTRSWRICRPDEVMSTPSCWELRMR